MRHKCKYFSQPYLLCNTLFISALQNLLFCVPKAAVLHGKSVGFASQKSRFRNAKSKLPFSFRIIFTKPRRFSRIVSKVSKRSCKSQNILKDACHLLSSNYCKEANKKAGKGIKQRRGGHSVFQQRGILVHKS